MQLYKDISGDSGIYSYRIDPESITIKFKHGPAYIYNYASAGVKNIKNMKKLAVLGKGLATYISRHVKDNYAEKLDI